MSHTRGPWSVGKVTRAADTFRHSISGKGGRVIAWTLMHYGPEWKQDTSDAYLIASAPELFRALERMLTRYRGQAPNDGTRWDGEEWQSAEAALAMASLVICTCCGGVGRGEFGENARPGRCPKCMGKGVTAPFDVDSIPFGPP